MQTSAWVRDVVRQDCLAESNIFGVSFFDQHLEVVAGYAHDLASPLGADPETVELAAWLHDLSAVRDPATLPDHPRRSAELAFEMLANHGCASALYHGVARAIASHAAPLAPASASPEEVCLSDADALAQIARPAYWLYFAFKVRRLDFEAARAWLLARYEANWKALAEPARALGEERYQLARRVL